MAGWITGSDHPLCQQAALTPPHRSLSPDLPDREKPKRQSRSGPLAGVFFGPVIFGVLLAGGLVGLLAAGPGGRQTSSEWSAGTPNAMKTIKGLQDKLKMVFFQLFALTCDQK